MSGSPPTSLPAGLGLAKGAAMVLAGLGLVALVGAYPTWRFCGRAGLVSAAWAAAVNALVFALSIVATYWVARKAGGLAAGKAFLFTGLPRMALLVGAAYAAADLVGIEDGAFWLWAGGCYVVMVMMEALWVARGSAGGPRPGSPRG